MVSPRLNCLVIAEFQGNFLQLKLSRLSLARQLSQLTLVIVLLLEVVLQVRESLSLVL